MMSRYCRVDAGGFAMIEGILTAALILLGIAGAISTSQAVNSLQSYAESTGSVTHVAREYSFLLYQYADSLRGGADKTVGNGNGNAYVAYKKLTAPEYKRDLAAYCQAMVEASQAAGNKARTGGGSDDSMMDEWARTMKTKVSTMDFMLESCRIEELPYNAAAAKLTLFYSYNDLSMRTAQDGVGKNGSNPNCPKSAGVLTKKCEALYLAVVQPNS